jgi:hypothetical protein
MLMLTPKQKTNREKRVGATQRETPILKESPNEQKAKQKSYSSEACCSTGAYHTLNAKHSMQTRTKLHPNQRKGPFANSAGEQNRNC